MQSTLIALRSVAEGGRNELFETPKLTFLLPGDERLGTGGQLEDVEVDEDKMILLVPSCTFSSSTSNDTSVPTSPLPLSLSAGATDEFSSFVVVVDVSEGC